MPSLVITTVHGSKVSNLTGSTLDEAESISASTSESSCNNAESGSIADSESISSESIADSERISSESISEEVCLSGRPRGSTVQATVDLKKRIELATHDAVVSLSEAVSKKGEENV